MTISPSTSLVLRVPLLDIPVELSVRAQKVLATALATFALLAIQLGFSLAISFSVTCLFAALTFLAETYLPKEAHDQREWFTLDFSKRELFFWCTLLLAAPFLATLFRSALGLPPPPIPQTGLVEMILARPWRMISIAVLLAPIVEEILFRGFLLERLEDGLYLFSRFIHPLSLGCQRKVSNIGQALIFSAVHFRSKVEESAKKILFISIALVGHGFGEVKRTRNGLIYPMVCHSIKNLSFVVSLLSWPRRR